MIESGQRQRRGGGVAWPHSRRDSTRRRLEYRLAPHCTRLLINCLLLSLISGSYYGRGTKDPNGAHPNLEAWEQFGARWEFIYICAHPQIGAHVHTR